MRRIAQVLSICGGAIAVLGLSKVHARWVADSPYDFTNSFRLSWALGFILFLGVATYAVGLPDTPRSWKHASVHAVLAAGVAALGVSVLQLAVGDALLPRFVVFGAALLTVPYQVAVNAVSRGGRSRDEERDRVLLIGALSERERLLDDLRLEPERSASLVATLTPVEAAGSPGHTPVLAAQMSSGATVVVLDRYAQAEDRVIAQAAKLHESGVRVRTLQSFYEEWLGKIPVSELERASLFFDIGEVHGVRYSRFKRVLDLAVGLSGTFALMLAVPVVWIGNRIANPGPLFFRQTRVGKGGELFTIYKFRTMRQGEHGGLHDTTWTKESDPRVTPFGRVLRNSHLDELPQVINIVRGDLSIVGPRPEQAHYVEELSEKLAFYNLRHLVRPGLTGWAQVKYGYAGDERDALEKLQYEFFYLRHQNLKFDLRVMMRTLRSVTGGSGSGR